MAEDIVTIIGISGSLRKHSLNSAVLRAAAELAPAGCTIKVASIEAIPLYNGDIEETEGIPAVVSQLKDQIAKVNALLLVTPEYNNSIPGVMKNAIDWLSRPPEDIDRVFGGKPVGLIGASPGRMGTVNAQTAWLTVFRALGMTPWFGENLYISRALDLFDGSGQLADRDTLRRLANYVEGFVAFIREQQRHSDGR
jgi:NAD(P)H-dependent FMN reductase